MGISDYNYGCGGYRYEQRGDRYVPSDYYRDDNYRDDFHHPDHGYSRSRNPY